MHRSKAACISIIIKTTLLLSHTDLFSQDSNKTKIAVEANIYGGLSSPFGTFAGNNPRPGRGSIESFANPGIMMGASAHILLSKHLGLIAKYQKCDYQMDGDRYFTFVKTLRSPYNSPSNTITYLDYKVGTISVGAFLTGIYFQSRFKKLICQVEVLLGRAFIKMPEVYLIGQHSSDSSQFVSTQVLASNYTSIMFSPGISLKYPINKYLYVAFYGNMWITQIGIGSRLYPDQVYYRDSKHNNVQVKSINTMAGIGLRF